jgi:hypothetical protein
MKFLLPLSLVFLVAACSSGNKDAKRTNATPVAAEAPKMEAQAVQNVTANWPQQTKDLLNKLTKKYGQPTEATTNMVIWKNNSPWKRTTLYKTPGNSMLEQVAEMEVGPERLGEIAMFNKGIIIDQEKNEVITRSDKEAMNFLAMNLTKEISDGRMSSMEARRQYTNVTDAMGKSNYTENLKFQSEEDKSPDTL